MSCNNSASDDGSVKSFFANWPMSTCGLNLKGQFAIVYNGSMCVYDGIPAEKRYRATTPTCFCLLITVESPLPHTIHQIFLSFSSSWVFFLKHAEAVEKDLPAKELHELLLLSLQWLSGMISLSNPVCPLQLLREIETKVWLLAVESETQVKSEGDFNLTFSTRESAIRNDFSIIDRTASIIAKMDNHINTMRNRTVEKYESRENNQMPHKNQVVDAGLSTTFGGNTKPKRRAKGYVALRRPTLDSVEKKCRY
ncbi:unnamed protein product [Vicia faba]|uniref:Uncharacterized protein n=1 Tax=Vicia faba TaxID=3906 RepID=A0AAV0Z4B5_VICFA|nr:unnamed protein product [Vicia faba]